jgi:flagellar motor switch protein FliN/FliY
MTTTQPTQPALHAAALYTAAAQALASVLPTALPVTAQLHAGPRDGAAFGGPGEVAAASFVGQLSADVAVQVDASLLAGAEEFDAGPVSIADVLRPSLEAATAVLGVGVLSGAADASAEALLADGETVLFRLEAAGAPAGWFALRLRDNGGSATHRAPASPGADRASAARLGRINNVEMALTVEIGRTRMSVRDVLNLEPGAVVELDRSAGAPADVLLNGRLIAHGEVVVMDQDYGIRITEILDVAEGLN